jgi:hypothetical protein
MKSRFEPDGVTEKELHTYVAGPPEGQPPPRIEKKSQPPPRIEKKSHPAGVQGANTGYWQARGVTRAGAKRSKRP